MHFELWNKAGSTLKDIHAATNYFINRQSKMTTRIYENESNQDTGCTSYSLYLPIWWAKVSALRLVLAEEFLDSM